MYICNLFVCWTVRNVDTALSSYKLIQIVKGSGYITYEHTHNQHLSMTVTVNTPYNTLC